MFFIKGEREFVVLKKRICCCFFFFSVRARKSVSRGREDGRSEVGGASGCSGELPSL